MDCEVYHASEEASRNMVIPQVTWTLLHGTQVPSPGSWVPCLLFPGKAPAAGWICKCSLNGPFPTQHRPPASRLFRSSVILDILLSFQGLTIPPASTLNNYVLLWLFTPHILCIHNSFLISFVSPGRRETMVF